MTREKHLRIVSATLKKGLAAGWSADQVSEAIVSKIETALELEEMDANEGVLDRPVEVPRPDLDKSRVSPRVDPLPIPDVNSGPEASLIILPGSENAKQAAPKSQQAVGPLRIQPVGNTVAGKRYWSMETMRDAVEKGTPPEIQIVPRNRTKPITLKRDIFQLLGLDLCRLSYMLDGTVQPTASSQNEDGNDLDSIRVDQVCSVLFSAYEKDLMVDERMEQIHSQAMEIFSPRPETIVSTAPRRPGLISYSGKDIHYEEDQDGNWKLVGA